MSYKIISNKDLNKLKKIKRPFVLLPMAADIIHYGHTRIIKKASNLGNVIVGLMTDKSILSYKKSSSFFSYRYRKEILNSFKYIKLIIPLKGLVYDEITELIKPDYFVHGSDWNKPPQLYAKNKLKKTIKIKRLNCKIRTFEYTKKISSTIIKNQ